MERRSHESLPEVRAAASLPDRHLIRQREIERALGRLLRLRPYILPLLAVTVLALVLWAPTRERVVAWFLFAIPVACLVSVDRWRIARGRLALAQVPYDLLAVILMQGVLVSLTGLIDSPALPVLVVMSAVSGVALGMGRTHVLLVVLLSIMVWLLLAVEVHGWWPSVAALLRPPPLDMVRVGWRAITIQIFVLIAAGGGVLVHGMMMHGIDAAIDAREELLDSLAQRNAELTSLSGALAHELKNPLASIHGLVTLIERNDDNRARRFEVLRREIDRMKLTVDELLEFSRPSGAPAPLVPARLFGAVSAEREAAAEARGVVIAAPDADGAHWVVADERKLRRALANLLDNAIDASADGGRIEWIARAVGDRLELGVGDRGPGLPEGAGRLGFTTKPEGSGLGLAVSRTIAEQHGGELIVRAREGGGAEVVLALPRAQGSQEASR